MQWTKEQMLLAGTMGAFGVGYVLTETYESIWQALKILGRQTRKRKGASIKLGGVRVTDDERVRHSHIVGSPGSGKTEALKTLIFEDIKRGRGCLIIDAKGDRELYDEVLGCAKSHGREADVALLSPLFPDESSWWNPCAIGTASELQSKFLNANIYDHPFYAKACESALIHCFNRLCEEMKDGFSLAHLTKALHSYAQEKKNQDLLGLFYDFESLLQSEWASVLTPSKSDRERPEVNLLEVVQNNKILFIQLPTEGRNVQSSRVGRLLTQEIIMISGMRKSMPELAREGGVFAVYVDEFDAFATESFVSFLNKGRSSRMMITIAHQTLSDLRKVSPAFATQVLGLCNVHIIFRTDDPDDAELWSRFLGTKKSIKSTYQTQGGGATGAASNREVLEFKVDPDTIKDLGVGECVVSIKTARIQKKVKLPLPKSFVSKTSREVSDQNSTLRPTVRGHGRAADLKTEHQDRGRALNLDHLDLGLSTQKNDSISPQSRRASSTLSIAAIAFPGLLMGSLLMTACGFTKPTPNSENPEAQSSPSPASSPKTMVDSSGPPKETPAPVPSSSSAPGTTPTTSAPGLAELRFKIGSGDRIVSHALIETTPRRWRAAGFQVGSFLPSETEIFIKLPMTPGAQGGSGDFERLESTWKVELDSSRQLDCTPTFETAKSQVESGALILRLQVKGYDCLSAPQDARKIELKLINQDIEISFDLEQPRSPILQTTLGSTNPAILKYAAKEHRFVSASRILLRPLSNSTEPLIVDLPNWMAADLASSLQGEILLSNMRGTKVTATLKQKIATDDPGKTRLVFEIVGLDALTQDFQEREFQLVLTLRSQVGMEVGVVALKGVILPLGFSTLEVNWTLNDSGQPTQDGWRSRMSVPSVSAPRHWVANGITWPEKVPDAFWLRINVPADLMWTEKLEFKLRALTSEGAALKELFVDKFKIEAALDSDPRAPRAQILAKGSGLAEVLSAAEEQEIQLRLELLQAGKSIAVIHIPILTPPSAVRWRQIPVQKALQEFEVTKALQRLGSPANELALLQVLEVSSNSARPVEVTVPLHPKAILKLNVDSIDWESAGPDCAKKKRVLREEHPYNTRLSLMPLSSDLQESWPSYAASARTTLSLTLASQSKVLFGVFGDDMGPEFVLRPENYREVPDQMDIQVSCHFGCDQPIPLDRYLGVRARIPAQSFQAAAMRAVVDQCEKCAQHQANHCVACEELERKELTVDWLRQPYFYERFCAGKWHRIEKTEKLPFGIQTYPLFLELGEEEPEVLLRNALFSREIDPEVRRLRPLPRKSLVFE